MIKHFTIVLTISLILFLGVGCSASSEIDLPFSADDVVELELFRYVVPAAAEQKIISSSTEIQSIISTIKSTKIKFGKEEPYVGGETTSFRFHLKNGETYEISAGSIGEGKAGDIKFSDSTSDYIAKTYIGVVWEECKSEANPVEESKLPGYDN